MRHRLGSIAVTAAATLVVLAGCSSDDGDDPQAAPTTDAATTESSETAPAPTGPIESLADLVDRLACEVEGELELAASVTHFVVQVGSDEAAELVGETLGANVERAEENTNTPVSHYLPDPCV